VAPNSSRPWVEGDCHWCIAEAGIYVNEIEESLSDPRTLNPRVTGSDVAVSVGIQILRLAFRAPSTAMPGDGGVIGCTPRLGCQSGK